MKFENAPIQNSTIENPERMMARAVSTEQEMPIEKVETDLHDFFQNELGHYQEAIAVADCDDKRNAYHSGFLLSEVPPSTDTEVSGEVTDQHSPMGMYYLRHIESAKTALKDFDAGDHVAVLRYLEKKLAQADGDDERNPEDIRQMRVLESQVYQFLHPDFHADLPGREEMEAFFRTEQEREQQHNRREADSGLFSDLVVTTRDAYMSGDAAAALQLIELALGALSNLAEHQPRPMLGGRAFGISSDDSRGRIWETAPSIYAEELRRLWMGLASRGSNMSQ